MKIQEILNSPIFKIILIALFIRLLGISYPYISEEATQIPKFTLHDLLYSSHYPNSTNPIIIHPPLATLLYLGSTQLFGISVASMRIVPVIFGLGVIWLCYLFSKKLYDGRTAIIASLLLAISFYPVWSSLYIDLDGSILLFFVTATLYSYFRYRTLKQDKKSLYFASLFFGLALLTKYPAIFIIPIILLAESNAIIREGRISLRSIIAIIQPILKIIFLGLIIFSIFPVTAILANNQATFLNTLSHGADNVYTSNFQAHKYISSLIISLAKNVFFIVQYATPLVLIVAVMAFKNRKPEESLLLSWIAVFFVAYIVLAIEGGKVRYLAILIPPLYVLSAKRISDILSDFKRSDMKLIIYLSLIFLAIIIALNMYGSIELFGLQNMNLRTIIDNGFLWYSGRGSASFMIHIHSFIFVVAASAILFAASFKQKYFKNAMLLLIALNITFSSFILFQSFYPTVGPQYEKTLQNLALNYTNSTEPLYGLGLFPGALNIYFGDSIVGDYAPGKEGKVIMINLQLFEDTQYKKYIMDNCALKATYISNNYPSAYVYNC